MWDALQEAELERALVATLREQQERHEKQLGQQELHHLYQLLKRELPLGGGAVGDEDAEVAGSPLRSCALPAKAHDLGLDANRDTKREVHRMAAAAFVQHG